MYVADRILYFAQIMKMSISVEEVYKILEIPASIVYDEFI